MGCQSPNAATKTQALSVALALSLPESEWKPLILTATYMVVIFSIIVQGLTVAGLAERINTRAEARQ